jgi:hypothetical protein
VPSYVWAGVGGVGGAVFAFLYLYYGVVRPTLAIKFAELEKWQERELGKMRREFDEIMARYRRPS